MILAIDQGSTKTQALIGDRTGRVLGTGMAGGACHFMVGVNKSMEMVWAAAEAAMENAGVKAGCIDTVSAGMAGANWPDEFQLLKTNLQKLFPSAEISVYNDVVPALYAGTGCPDAIILCAGSSFNAAVLKDRKLEWIFNNYIEARDDGGKSLSEIAMEGIFRAENCMGPATSLRERAMEFFGYTEILPMLLDFSRKCMKIPVKDFATVVDEEAMKGDAVALDAQYRFGKSVSRYAVGALKRFDLLGRPTDIVLSGGIFKARSSVMTDAIRTEVHRVAPLARIVEAYKEPIVGAYELALDPETVRANSALIGEMVEKFGLYRR